jgi:hypothetical protein
MLWRPWAVIHESHDERLSIEERHLVGRHRRNHAGPNDQMKKWGAVPGRLKTLMRYPRDPELLRSEEPCDSV